MRDFKVWCKNKKEWEKHSCFLNQNGVLYHDDGGAIYQMTILREDTHIVVFSTGKKDKNGDDILDGSIVRLWWEEMFFSDLVVGVVEWNEGDAAYHILFPNIGSSVLMANIDLAYAEILVIGHYLEHPELVSPEVLHNNSLEANSKAAPSDAGAELKQESD